MLERTEQVAAWYDTVVANIAHASDGNLYPPLITPRRGK
jgi:hypothetical protein